MKWYRKYRRTINSIVVVLAFFVLLGFCMNALGAFDGLKESVKEQTVNDANLLKVADYEEIDGEYNGVTVKVLKDGTIKLDGTATADTTIILSEHLNGYGLMTFAKLDMGDEAENSYICVGTKSGSAVTTIYGQTSSTNSVTFTASTTAPAIALVIAEGDTFDEVSVRPVLVYGVVPQTFYTVV